ncbi:MAG: hypothetical protein P4K93_09765 [Terracidiphilus sp.]|nr:hypothetical protein [Terracidiphilus sp.]
MDTNQKMDLMLCQEALDRYRDIENALQRGSIGYAKDRLKDLKSFLAGQTQHSAFRNAGAYLPKPSANPGEWKSGLAYSRDSLERYLHKLEAELAKETDASNPRPTDP